MPPGISRIENETLKKNGRKGERNACGEPLKICESGIISEVFGTELSYSEAEKCYYYKY